MSSLDTLVAEHGDKPFLFENGQVYSYSQLAAASALCRKELENIPVDAGIFILESSNSFETYTKICALLGSCRPFLQVSSFQFKDPTYEAVLKTELSSNLFFLPQTKSFGYLTVQGRGLHADIAKFQSQKKSLFIVRTSGSSGKKPKFILHDSQNFIKKYNLIGAHFERTMAFSPAESIAGMETFLETVVHGRAMVTAQGSFEPKKVATLLTEHTVDYFQTTPSFLNLLLLSGACNLLTSSLKKIAFGSEPPLKASLLALQSKTPWVKLMHTYGMSEIGILSTETSEQDPSLFKLNTAVNRSRIKDGLLEVKSSTPLLCYLNYPYSDREWFETQDVAEQVGDFCRVLGRSGDLINIAGNKFFPSEVEEKLMLCPGITDVAVSREDNPLIGSALAAKINIDPMLEEKKFRESFKEFCSAVLPVYMQPHRLIITTEPLSNSRFKKSRLL